MYLVHKWSKTFLGVGFLYKRDYLWKYYDDLNVPLESLSKVS